MGWRPKGVLSVLIFILPLFIYPSLAHYAGLPVKIGLLSDALLYVGVVHLWIGILAWMEALELISGVLAVASLAVTPILLEHVTGSLTGIGYGYGFIVGLLACGALLSTPKGPLRALRYLAGLSIIIYLFIKYIPPEYSLISSILAVVLTIATVLLALAMRIEHAAALGFTLATSGLLLYAFSFAQVIAYNDDVLLSFNIGLVIVLALGLAVWLFLAPFLLLDSIEDWLIRKRIH